MPTNFTFLHFIAYNFTFMYFDFYNFISWLCLLHFNSYNLISYEIRPSWVIVNQHDHPFYLIKNSNYFHWLVCIKMKEKMWLA